MIPEEIEQLDKLLFKAATVLLVEGFYTKSYWLDDVRAMIKEHENELTALHSTPEALTILE